MVNPFSKLYVTFKIRQSVICWLLALGIMLIKKAKQGDLKTVVVFLFVFVFCFLSSRNLLTVPSKDNPFCVYANVGEKENHNKKTTTTNKQKTKQKQKQQKNEKTHTSGSASLSQQINTAMPHLTSRCRSQTRYHTPRIPTVVGRACDVPQIM